MPLQRRLPKRGFRNIFARQVDIVNLSSLNRFEPGSTVDPGAMAQLGLVPAVHGKRREAAEAKPLRNAPQVKILAKGTLDRKLVVRAHAFSEAAKAAIEAQGGSVEVLA